MLFFLVVNRALPSFLPHH